VPRTPLQAIAFLFGLWIALSLAPFRASGEETGAAFAELEAQLHRGVNAVRTGQHLIALERRA
jgi:hypothetical protein